MRNSSHIAVLIFYCLLVGVSAIARADDAAPDLLTLLDDGFVNWSKGIIAAKGKAVPPEIHQGNQQGRSMAVRQAIGNATDNLFNAIQKIQIDANTRVGDVVADGDEIFIKLKSMVKDANVVGQKYMTDGTVEVMIQMSLNGGFAQLILPPEIKQIESVKPILPGNTSDASTRREHSEGNDEGEPADEPAAGQTEKNDPPETYTGVVVDARGIVFRPAMAPRIVDENGAEVFGAEFASREYAVQQGMCGYTKELAGAAKDPRVADNPMMLKGIRTKGLGQCDILVSNSDANRLRSDFKHLDVLKQCRVLIVLD